MTNGLYNTPAAIRSILPELAEEAGIDWSKPLAEWSADTMVEFIHLALDLTDQASASAKAGKKYTITVLATPDVDPIKALRWVLKGLLRRHGMRCVGLKEAHDDQDFG